MSDRFASRGAVAAKIEWEGGIVTALDYGIKAADMPEGDTELAEAWDRLETAWHRLEPLVAVVETMLDEAEPDYDEDGQA